MRQFIFNCVGLLCVLPIVVKDMEFEALQNTPWKEYLWWIREHENYEMEKMIDDGFLFIFCHRPNKDLQLLRMEQKTIKINETYNIWNR